MRIKKYTDRVAEIKSSYDAYLEKYPGNWNDDDDEEDEDLGVNDDTFGRPYYPSKSIDSIDDPDEDDNGELPDDDMDHLKYLLRTLFKNSGIHADIESKNLDISIYIVLNKREKMKNILKSFDVAKKLKKDILPQYDSEFELWDTASHEPMLVFNFLYEGKDGDPIYDGEAPF